MRITIDEATPGSGKTVRALQDAISFPAKYLFATERMNSIRDVARDVRAWIAARGKHMLVEPIVSDDDNIKHGIRETVERLPGKFGNDEHVIAVVSHTALMMSDTSGFDGWHLIIDEIPNVLAVQEVRTFRDAAFFEEHYTLEPLPGHRRWSRIVLTTRDAHSPRITSSTMTAIATSALCTTGS
jgi:hypothetical protein